MTLFHRDLRGAGKPLLVVLHGLLGSSRNWLSTGADLAAGFHVMAVDLRNHGRSPHSVEMNYGVMVADLIEWMAAQRLERVSLMGHSLGGKVAMVMACRYPEKVERLIVVDIAPKDYLSAAHRAEFAAMNELDLRSIQSRGEAELRFEARVPDWAMRKFLTTNLERNPVTGEWKWLVNLRVLTETLATLEANPLSPEDQYNGPTLVVKGGKSRYVALEDEAAFRVHFPQVRIVTLEKSGHNPHMEDRPAFVEAIRGEI